ncbi:unnamed protein product, partial [Linum tenue]
SSIHFSLPIFSSLVSLFPLLYYYSLKRTLSDIKIILYIPWTRFPLTIIIHSETGKKEKKKTSNIILLLPSPISRQAILLLDLL